jgi:hypothetical protein
MFEWWDTVEVSLRRIGENLPALTRADDMLVLPAVSEKMAAYALQTEHLATFTPYWARSNLDCQEAADPIHAQIRRRPLACFHD